jgi:osmotically-inducible protein OsmY
MFLKNLLIVTSLFVLSSCVETVLVGTATTGTLVVREKNMDDTRKDIVISSAIATKFLENGLKNPGNSIDVTVNEGRVLLTGIARNPDKANKASELAWRVAGVKEVIDEIQLAKDSKMHFHDLANSFSDYLISWQIETKLFLDKEISTTNYQITTVTKTVYLLGVASSEDEMNKVLSVISKVKGVKKVVNHAILVGDARRKK